MHRGGETRGRVRILIAAQDETCRRVCANAAELAGFEFAFAGSDAAGLLKAGGIELVIADTAMPGLNLPEVIRVAKSSAPAADVLIIADSPAMPAASQALIEGALDYIRHPFNAGDLEALLDRVIKNRQQTDPQPPVSVPGKLNAYGRARQGLGEMIGGSAKIQAAYERILKVAPGRHPVLILGESGTGKELVARAIHAYGPACDLPFVPVDCGALSSTLIESELFGHVRGAFTGANHSRSGLLVAAGKGTVFLDEIAELPFELQSKLLRAIQEREVRPLGSNQRIPLEARILAGTNQHLEGAITRGTFRKDLFFRLNVVSIKLPPLRDRKSDIPALARHFADRYGGENGFTGISYEAMARLVSYEWPGNVRELENCIQRSVALGKPPEIQVQDLASSLLYGMSGSAPEKPVSTLQEIECEAIRQALEVASGDRVRAARLLGIGKTTVYRKIKEYGLEKIWDAATPS